MECPHCKKEVFGKSHDVSKYYEEPKPLTKDEIIEQLQAKNDEYKRFIAEVANMTHRTVADNTTDEAERNGVTAKICGFISTARYLEQALKEGE